jgi:hypothetical protein
MTDLRVSTNAGDELVLGSSDLEALRAKLRGPLLLAGDAGYDEARTIFNAMTDHRPALIACPAAAADVIAAVRFARERDVLRDRRSHQPWPVTFWRRPQRLPACL